MIEFEYNTDECTSPSSLIIREKIFDFQISWCQIDILNNVFFQIFFILLDHII